MNTKSERFEMRLDGDILGRVDQWRSQQSDLPTRAEAMRRLVEAGLAKAGGESVHFSDGEKLIAFMLRDIYKHLKIDGEIDPEFLSDVLCGGHYWAPKWVMTGVYHNYEDDPRDVRFVVDVLDMWSFLEDGYEALSKKDKDRVEKEAEPFGKHVKFAGFDGNNEAPLLGIARFFPEKLDRFTRFKGRDLNSHAPMSAAYRRMLQVFEPMRRTLVGGGLNVTQIIALLKAMKWVA